MAISKKMMNIHALSKNVDLLACPICAGTMELIDQARFVCEMNHSFDISRQGYVHLAPQAHATKYDQSLFEARQVMMTNGFFDPLLEKISLFIQQHVTDLENLKIVDAGSGEGSHLTQILAQLPKNKFDGIGIDLSKDGVMRAARDYPGHSWLVADLAKSPFQNGSFDSLLNILSPANYAEFTRILKPNGLFIKVVPAKDYLKQLRAIFYETDEREERNPVTQVSAHFKDVQEERLTYDFPLNSLLLENLLHMTPLTWDVSQEMKETVLAMNIPFVTVDLTVMIGRNKPNGL